jgi:hypothetical protein
MDPTSLKTIQFGKYRGKQFEDAYQDKNYCFWCLSVVNGKSQPNFLAFIEYIRKYDEKTNRKYE